MKNAAKIRLSRVEQQLVKRSDWILTKNNVMQKIRVMLEELQTERQGNIWEAVPPFLQAPLSIAPKISRGENYRGLPWLVLDQPRCFNREEMLAIRTMFWWGEHFSVTLLVSGQLKQQLEPSLLSAFTILRKKGYAICIAADPWEHHFERNNYQSLDKVTSKVYRDLIKSQTFFKAGIRFPLADMETMPRKLNSEYRRLMKIVMA
jgi:hypothetical protein